MRRHTHRHNTLARTRDSVDAPYSSTAHSTLSFPTEVGPLFPLQALSPLRFPSSPLLFRLRISPRSQLLGRPPTLKYPAMSPPSSSRLTLAKLACVVALLLAIFVIEVQGKRHHTTLRSREQHGGVVANSVGKTGVIGEIDPIPPPLPHPLPVPPISPIGPAENPDTGSETPGLPVEPPTPVPRPVPGAMSRAAGIWTNTVVGSEPMPINVPDNELRGPLQASIGDVSDLDEQDRERGRPNVPPFRPVGPPPRIVPVGPERPRPPIRPVGPESPSWPIHPVGPERPPSPIHPVGPEIPPPQMGEGGEKLPPTWRPDEPEPERPPQMGEGGEKLPPTWTPDNPSTDPSEPPRIHPVGPERPPPQMGEGGEKLPPTWTPDEPELEPGVAIQSHHPSRRERLISEAKDKARSIMGSLFRLAHRPFIKVAATPELNSAPSSSSSSIAVDAVPTVGVEEPAVFPMQTEPATRDMAVVEVDPMPMPMPMPMPEPMPEPVEDPAEDADAPKERHHHSKRHPHGKHPHHRRPHPPPPSAGPAGPAEKRQFEKQRQAVQHQLHKLRKHLRKIESLLGPSGSGSGSSTRQFNDDDDEYTAYHKRHGAPKHMLAMLAGAGAAIALVALLAGCWALRNKRRRRMQDDMDQRRVMQQPLLSPAQAAPMAPTVAIPLAMPPTYAAYQPLATAPQMQMQQQHQQQQQPMGMPQITVQ